jgi:cold shock CspA family protein
VSSVIQMRGYRELQAGQRVRFTSVSPGQDGCAYTALSVWPVL